MPSEEKVVHQQQFQNAQQTVEVIVKAKPKARLALKTKRKPKSANFIRNCILKKELEKLTLEEEKQKRQLKMKSKNVNRAGPMTNIEISKKSVTNRGHKVIDVLEPLSPDSSMTWKERLDSYSSVFALSSQTNSDDSALQHRDINQNQRSHFHGKRGINENSKKMGMHLPTQINLSRVNGTSSNFGKQSQTQKIDVSVQTSLQAGGKNIFQPHPGQYPRWIPEDHIGFMSNQAKTSANQTHSPFGESALRLLHHLRERLQSIGDNEGSKIVSAIEACFGTGFKYENKDALPTEKTSSSPYLGNNLDDADVAEHLKRVVAEQERKLRIQEETIQELRSLSNKLLAYHEKFAHEVFRGTRDAQTDVLKITKSGKSHRICNDSGVDLESSEDVHKALKDRTLERDALLKEVKNQRGIILNLEIKLEQLSAKTAEIKQIKTTSSVSGLAYGAEANSSSSRKEDAETRRELLTGGLNNVIPSGRGPVESEADSAFEEKSSKSASNMQSPNDFKRDRAPHEPASVSQHIRNDFRSREFAPHPSDMVSLPARGEAGIPIFPHELQGPGDTKPPAASNNYSISFVSDVSDVHSDLRPTQTSSDLRRGPKYETHLSETPLLAPTSQYLESTHVRDRGKWSNSASKPAVQMQQRFDPHFSSECSYRVGTASLAPESCSNSDIEVEDQS